MKNVLKKIVAGTAIVSTVACLSVSAFAATASVSSDKNSVTLTDWTAGSSTNQYTVVIVPADASEINENNIYYINQDTGANLENIVKSMGVKGTLADGDYQVRIGTDVANTEIVSFDFKVTTTPTGVQIKWGDVDGNGVADSSDAAYIAAFFTGGADSVGGIYKINETISDGLVFGDVDGNGVADSSDAAYIAAYFAGGSDNVGGEYKINETVTVPGK